jgi:biopolymer transport protein ExbD
VAGKVGGGGGGRYTVEQNADINVTPFVDVMLVLLIIFMVSAPLATVSIRLDFPPAVPPPPNQKLEEPTFISIQKTGSIFIGDKQSSPETLTADLYQVIGKGEASTKERIFIRADADVLYGQFMEVMNELQDNGFFQIGLIGEDIS